MRTLLFALILIVVACKREPVASMCDSRGNNCLDFHSREELLCAAGMEAFVQCRDDECMFLKMELIWIS